MHIGKVNQHQRNPKHDILQHKVLLASASIDMVLCPARLPLSNLSMCWIAYAFEHFAGRWVLGSRWCEDTKSDVALMISDLGYSIAFALETRAANIQGIPIKYTGEYLSWIGTSCLLYISYERRPRQDCLICFCLGVCDICVNDNADNGWCQLQPWHADLSSCQTWLWFLVAKQWTCCDSQETTRPLC